MDKLNGEQSNLVWVDFQEREQFIKKWSGDKHTHTHTISCDIAPWCKLLIWTTPIHQAHILYTHTHTHSLTHTVSTPLHLFFKIEIFVGHRFAWGKEEVCWPPWRDAFLPHCHLQSVCLKIMSSRSVCHITAYDSSGCSGADCYWWWWCLFFVSICSYSTFLSHCAVLPFSAHLEDTLLYIHTLSSYLSFLALSFFAESAIFLLLQQPSHPGGIIKGPWFCRFYPMDYK